ncbi:MAG: hypothetical protein HND48_03375 [Chloroflexi bacterium]|nr:hypothetical protein [Chloroflexota bacterium]
MAEKFTAFSTRDIASRDRLEDYSADAVVTTAGGLTLHVAIVADGAGGGEAGEPGRALDGQDDSRSDSDLDRDKCAAHVGAVG